MTTNLGPWPGNMYPPIRAHATANITPFTYYDGLSFLEVLEALRAWLRETLIPGLDGIIEIVDGMIQDTLEKVEIDLEVMRQELNDALASIELTDTELRAYVDDAVDGLTAYVDDAVQQVINNSIELQDSVMAGVIDDELSESRKILDILYARSLEGEEVPGASADVRIVDGDPVSYINGILQPDSLLTSSSVGDSTFPLMQVRPQLVRYPFSEGAVGVLSGSGALPRAFRAVTTSSAWEVTSSSATSLDLRIVPSGSDAGSMRLVFADGYIPTSDIIVSFTANISAPDGNPYLRMYWSNGPFSGTGQAIETLHSDEKGSRRITVRMAPTGLASLGDIRFHVTQGSTLATQIDLSISELSVHEDAIPEYANDNLRGNSSGVATSATLSVPDGSYAVAFLSRRYGLILRNGLAQNGSGINLRDTIYPASIGDIVRVVAVPRSAWSPRLSNYITGKAPSAVPNDVFDYAASRAAGSTQRKLVTWTPAYQITNYSTTRTGLVTSTKVIGHTITNTGPGDSTGGANYRGELIRKNYAATFGVDTWVSFAFKVNDPVTNENGFAIINQFRYTNDSGDSSVMSPDLSIGLFPDSRVSMGTRSDPVNLGTDQRTPPTVPDGASTITPGTVHRRWDADYRVGQWHNVVYRVVFSNNGGGDLQCWFDGEEVFNAEVPVGYNRAAGPVASFGVYRNATSEVVEVEHQNVEWGTKSLFERVNNPLPIG